MKFVLKVQFPNKCCNNCDSSGRGEDVKGARSELSTGLQLDQPAALLCGGWLYLGLYDLHHYPVWVRVPR